MSWNYRVIRHDKEEKIFYQIHEVYYDDNNKIETFTENAVHPFGESIEELITDLDHMLGDARKYEVLSLRELEKQILCRKKKAD